MWGRAAVWWCVGGELAAGTGQIFVATASSGGATLLEPRGSVPVVWLQLRLCSSPGSRETGAACVISSSGALCATCRANSALTPTSVHRVSLTWECCPPMVVPALCQLQGTTKPQLGKDSSDSGIMARTCCNLNPEVWSSHKSVHRQTSRCLGCFNELVSNRAVLVHYTALWVLNCDPSTGRGTCGAA